MTNARGRLSPSHELMAANDWKTPGGGSSAEEVNFLSQYSSYFSRLKESRDEGPAHGLCLSVFLSS